SSQFSFSGAVSQYFDVEDIISTSGETVLAADGTFAVNNAGLTLTDDAKTGSLEISIVLRPKAGFAGGNNVPILLNDSLYCSSGEDAVELILNERTRAVNVPLAFTVKAHSHVTNVSGQRYSVSQLYTDNYAGVRDSLAD